MKNTIILHTTVAKIEDARKISQILLEQKLIGCAQISGPIESIYRWDDTIATEKEYTLTMKTTSELADETMAVIEANHPYDVAEIVGHRLDFCSTKYHDWLVGEVKNVSA